jgi:hypothetical protein
MQLMLLAMMVERRLFEGEKGRNVGRSRVSNGVFPYLSHTDTGANYIYRRQTVIISPKKQIDEVIVTSAWKRLARYKSRECMTAAGTYNSSNHLGSEHSQYAKYLTCHHAITACSKIEGTGLHDYISNACMLITFVQQTQSIAQMVYLNLGLSSPNSATSSSLMPVIKCSSSPFSRRVLILWSANHKTA